MRKIIIFLLAVSFYASNARDYINDVVIQHTVTNPMFIIGEEIESKSERYDDLFDTDLTQIKNEKERGFIVNNPFGLVMLEIPQSGNTSLSGELIVDVSLEYSYSDLSGALVNETEQIQLVVNSDGNNFKNVDYVKIDKALKVKATITNVSSSISNYTDVSLNVSCRGEYYDMLSPNAIVQNAVYNLGADNKPINGNLDIIWDKIVVNNEESFTPEAYELEWTYSSNPEGIEAVYLRDYLFRNNSSRVVVSDNKYSIPLVYEKGLIAFRVRAIGRNISNGNIVTVKSKWTFDESQNTLSKLKSDFSDTRFYYEFSGLEINLNWQSTITFAEEGKNKAVVTYHDGSLRNRQAVTRINTDERVVVGESFYDYNGRPVIQVLPAPVPSSATQNENNFDYRPNFNLIEGQTEIRKEDYATGESKENCDPKTPLFSTNTGASNYYSGDNNFDNDIELNFGNNIINEDLIPDAEQIPYTQIVYRNDNTDRIVFQSGVGKAHTIGSGHETTYMYAAPAQSELSRLFGNQVGLSGHYKKNTIIDPNGQASVSYMNPEGKVIATALTGANSTNLEALDGESDRMINSELLSATTNIKEGDRQKIFDYKFAVVEETKYTFNYTLEPESHEVICKRLDDPTKEITLNLLGVFDARLSLTDNCGDEIFSKEIATDAGFGEGVANVSYSISQAEVTLQKGEHSLSKVLTINEEKLNGYLDEYLTNENYTCLLTLADFTTGEDEIDLGGCNLNCTSCLERIEASIAEVESLGAIVSEEKKEELRDNCNALCMDNLTCKAALFAMIAHVSLDGQYGGVRAKDPAVSNATKPIDRDNPEESLEVDEDRDVDTEVDGNGDHSLILNNDTKLTPELYPLSIFNVNNRLTTNFDIRKQLAPGFFVRPSWRTPVEVRAKNRSAVFNKNNQSMFEDDISDADYSLTNYYSVSGDIVYARILRSEEDDEDDVASYFPEISDVVSQDDEGNPLIESAFDQLVLLENERESGQLVYNIPLKFLKNFEDFYPYWESHFANYLVPYHPEFGYYVECTSRKRINEYREVFVDLRYPEDEAQIINEGQVLDATGGVIEEGFNGEDFLIKHNANGEIYYTENVIASDPIFHLGDLLVGELRDKVTNFQKKYRADGSEIIPNEYYSMAERATQIIGCPDPFGACKRSDCETGNFGALDEEEWSQFKAYYITERDKVLKTISSKRANIGMYYNGCIGNEAFYDNGDKERTTFFRYGSLSNTFNLDLEIDSDRIGQKRIGAFLPCFAYFKDVSDHEFSTSVGRCGALSKNNIVKLPILDFNQTCSYQNGRLYENSMRVFYPKLDLDETPESIGAGESIESCFEIIKDANGAFSYVEGECNLAVVDKIELLKNKTEAVSYSSCGYCPIVDHFKTFTEELLLYEKFNVEYLDFNCVATEPNINLALELATNVTSNLGADPLDWDGEYTPSDKSFIGQVTSSDIGSNILRMKYDFSDFGPSNLTEEDFNLLLVSSYIGGVRLGSAKNEVVFSFKIEINPFANKVNTESLATLLKDELEDIEREGSVFTYTVEVPVQLFKVSSGTEEIIDLDICSFDPICETDKQTTDILDVLNSLVFENEKEGDEDVIGENELGYTEELIYKSNQLIVSEPVSLQDFSYSENALRELLNFTEFDESFSPVQPLNDLNINWVSDYGTDNSNPQFLNGTLTYEMLVNEEVVNKEIRLSISPVSFEGISNTFDFSNVERFMNVRPFVDENASCSEESCLVPMFYADAVVFEETAPGDVTITPEAGSRFAVFHRVVISMETLTNGAVDDLLPRLTSCRYINVSSSN